MSTSEHPPSVDSLEPRDWQALQRFVERTLGYGFRLAIVEVATARQRAQIIEGLRPLLGEQPAIVVALHQLPGENLWHELLAEAAPARSGQGILLLWGLEEAPEGGEALMIQLNVQRDLFVRDLPVPWVLFIHPALSVRLRMVAPDFCDLVPLWVCAASEEVEVKPEMGTRSFELSAVPPPMETDSSLLSEAELALKRWQLDEAQDLLARFDLAGTTSDVLAGQRALLGGRLARLRGDLSTARTFLDESIGISNKTGDRAKRAMALHELAIIEASQGQYDQARDLLRETLQISQKLSDRQGHAASLYQLASIEESQGRYDEAQGLLHEAIQIAEELDDRQLRAASLHLLAIIEVRQGRYEEARTLLREVIQIAEELDDRQVCAASLHQLAIIEAMQGRYEEARGLLGKVLQITEELGDRRGRAASLQGLAVVERTQGRYEEARGPLQEALQIAEELGDRQVRAGSLFHLGLLEAQAGRLREGRQLVREAVGIFERLGSGDLDAARAILAQIDGTAEDISEQKAPNPASPR